MPEISAFQTGLALSLCAKVSYGNKCRIMPEVKVKHPSLPKESYQYLTLRTKCFQFGLSRAQLPGLSLD